MSRSLLFTVALWLAIGGAARAADATRKTDTGLVSQPPSLPAIITPAAGQVFYAGNPVPIKLAPPNGLEGTDYLIREKKNAKGSWTNYTADPIQVSAAQAQSVDGYRGFTPGVGSWRLTATAFRPTGAYWSNPVEFTVATVPTNSPVRLKK